MNYETTSTLHNSYFLLLNSSYGFFLRFTVAGQRQIQRAGVYHCRNHHKKYQQDEDNVRHRTHPQLATYFSSFSDSHIVMVYF